ncbi:MAG TPA: TetR/AcrR family transcriptional regulator [Nitriliruptorales bacterium]
MVHAALAIARQSGLNTVSMRSVADRLGLHQTSLYTYVNSKDDLLTAMLEEVFAHQLRLPAADDPRPPAEQVTAIFRDLRQLALEHVDLLGLVGQLPARTTAPVHTLDVIVGLLGRMGLGPHQQRAAYALLHHVTVSSALVGGNRRLAGDGRGDALPLPVIDDPARYPAIAAVVATVDDDATADDAFEELLALVLQVTVPAMGGHR